MTDGRFAQIFTPPTPPDGRVYLRSGTKCNSEGGIRGIVVAILQELDGRLRLVGTRKSKSMLLGCDLELKDEGLMSEFAEASLM